MKGTVSAATLRDLIRDADRSGLFADADYGYLQITDVGDTRFTVRPDRAPARMVSVYALDIDDAYDMLTIGERANRQALRAFEQRLIDSVATPTAWLLSRVDVTELFSGSPDASRTAVSWPSPPLDTLLTAHRRGRCGVLSGHEAGCSD
jgi:hypothetical protein